MKPELYSLVWVSLFTSLLWIPYVMNRLDVGGIAATVGYPVQPTVLSPWAQRLKAAHANAVENLVVFAALILTGQELAISSPAIAMAAKLYLTSRIVHAVSYTFGISWIRTLAFTGGFVAQIIIAMQLLAALS